MARVNVAEPNGTNKLLVCFEDITGRELWPTLQEALAVRLPLTSILFENKFGKVVSVDELDVEFLSMKHHRIQRLRQHQNNPTTWFRLPYCRIIIVTAPETTDYKAWIRPKLNMMINGQRGTLEALCETLIVYVRPPEVEPQAKGPKKVFEKLRDDFNPKKHRERCVRLDLYDSTQLKDAQGMIVGLDALEAAIKDCIKVAFEARQSAYDEEARKLMSHRMDMKANFGTLFLVKDSLALMLESVRLLEDALREYYELEAACLEALDIGGSLNGQPFGGTEKGDDVATLMTASWKTVHQAVLANKPLKEFKLRQYLFSAKARLLFKLNRSVEVVERGLKFIQDFSKLIADHEDDPGINPSFREVWSFSACLSVASTAAKFYSSTEADLQNKQGLWFGQEAQDRARIQLSEVDWDVGVCGLEDVTADLDFDFLGGRLKKTSKRSRDVTNEARNWHFYSSLGHLYASAREELRRIFVAIYGNGDTGRSTADSLGSFHADMLPSFTPVCLSSSRGGSMDEGRRLSLSVQKSSNLIEALQKKVTRRQSTQQGTSFGSDGQFGYDVEGMPSWMTRAGLANTPKHSRKSTFSKALTPLPNTPTARSEASFVSVESKEEQEEASGEEAEEAVSVISHDTSMTPITESRLGDGAKIALRSVAGSSFYAESRGAPSESAMSSLDIPLAQPVRRTDTGSSRSIISHALGGSAYNVENSSDSYQGAVMQSVVVPDKLNWVVDWRIRRALASEELYEDLFVELTLAAAWCYGRCGRLRTSALLRVDVAPLLLSHGLVSAAQQLYHMKSDMYLREGWSVLSAHVLPQLCACLRGDDPKRLMSACLTYLSLQKDCTDPAETIKMMTDFTNCAKEIGEVDLDVQSALITSPALQVCPKKHWYSELYEEKELHGVALLAPAAVKRRSDDATLTGALLLNAGDVGELFVKIQSVLPEAIVLTDVTACLAIVGEDAVTGARSVTSMLDGTVSFNLGAGPPPDVPRTRVYRTHSIQELPAEKLQKSSMHLICSLSDGEEIAILPGKTTVRFRCCPVREGIYSLLYVSGKYLGTWLCLPLESEPEMAKVMWSTGQSRKKPSLMEGLAFVKPRLKEAVMLHVEPAVQRVDVSALISQGTLISGQAQWIGVLLRGSSSGDMEKGRLKITQSNQAYPISMPTSAYVTNKVRGIEEGIAGWIKIEEEILQLPPGFLYKGWFVVWLQLNLASVKPSFRRMSSDLSRAERSLDFDFSADLLDSPLQLETRLEYFNGCWRSHAALLRIPVSNAISLETNFLKIKNSTMLVTVRLASHLPFKADVQSVQLELHCNRKQNCKPSLIGPAVPTPLYPAEVMNIAFRLTKNEAKLLAAAAREAEDGLVTGEFVMQYTSDLYGKHKSLLPTDKNIPDLVFPPPRPEWDSASLHNSHFRCPLELDVLMGGDGPKNDLFKISLLPPPAITAGKPVALTWLLERTGSTHSKDNITYEILPETGWQACVPVHGTIYVPTKSNSSATLEAMFIANSEGDLQAPRLILTQNKIQSPLVFLKVTSDNDRATSAIQL